MRRLPVLSLCTSLLLFGVVSACASDPAPPPAAARLVCKDGAVVSGGYPETSGVREKDAIPDLSFATENGAVRMSEFFEPCADRSNLLLVRVGAPWCGTCDWHVAHTGELLDSDIGSRLRFFDLLISDQDNQPPTIDLLAGYRSRIDRPGKLAIDPDGALLSLNTLNASLPLYVFVDTKTMKVIRELANPGPDLLLSRARQELADLDGTAVPNLVLDERIDGFFGRDQWDLLHKMTVPGTPPADPTNRVADSPEAASFGKDLFKDVLLSPTGKVACATCHVPEKNFTDGLPQGIGVGKVDRRTPPIVPASHSPAQFWDGRADSLWSQALGPLESDLEMGSSRLYVATQIFVRYRGQYEAIFGPMPPFEDRARFPEDAKPGTSNWSKMAPADQELATRVFVNAGKSIAAFERTLRIKPTPFDAYVGGDKNALTDSEKSAVHNFFESSCAQCHHGPRLTDDAYHNIRFGTGRQDGRPDRGRAGGIPNLLANEFRASSAFSDAKVRVDQARDAWLMSIAPRMEGAFRTPSLRGSALTAPYGHGGTLVTAEDLANHYSMRGLPVESPLAVGQTESWVPLFAPHHAELVAAFVRIMRNEPAK